MTMDVHFHTLTPLWTGGSERNSAVARETGLLGSMRWWYEGIVRGMGGQACDPANGDRCEFDAKDRRPPEEQLCPACWLFGCTGWQRRFRVEATGLESHALFFVASGSVYQAAGNWLWRIFGGPDAGGQRSGRGANTTFSFGDLHALWGEAAALRVVPLRGDAQDTLDRVAFLLDVVARWGALGAKPQHGFGQIKIDDGLARTGQGRELIHGDVRRHDRPSARSPNRFALDSFFAHVYKLGEPEPYRGRAREIGQPPPGFDYRQHYIPAAFDIRYKSRSRDHRTGQGEDFGMRPWFREKWGKTVAHRLFGRSDALSDDQRSAGRIGVSHLYRQEDAWYLKVWGHVPDNLKDQRGSTISVLQVAGEMTKFVEAMFPGAVLVERFDRKEVLGP